MQNCLVAIKCSRLPVFVWSWSNWTSTPMCQFIHNSSTQDIHTAAVLEAHFHYEVEETFSLVAYIMFVYTCIRGIEFYTLNDSFVPPYFWGKWNILQRFKCNICTFHVFPKNCPSARDTLLRRYWSTRECHFFGVLGQYYGCWWPGSYIHPVPFSICGWARS